jgi:ABC-type multidrug transport system fused ATPase/permease subunit
VSNKLRPSQRRVTTAILSDDTKRIIAEKNFFLYSVTIKTVMFQLTFRITRLMIFMMLGLALAQCSTPKNACIQLTGLQQKHEKLSRKLSKPNAKTSQITIVGLLEGKTKKVNVPTVMTIGPGDLQVELPFFASHYQPSKRTFQSNERLNQRLDELHEQMENMAPFEEGYSILSSDTSKLTEYVPDRFDEQHRKAKRSGIISLLLLPPTAGLLLAVPLIGILAYSASVIFGFRSLKQYRNTINKKGRWTAMTALIIASIPYAFAIFAIGYLIIFFLFFWEGEE